MRRITVQRFQTDDFVAVALTPSRVQNVAAIKRRSDTAAGLLLGTANRVSARRKPSLPCAPIGGKLVADDVGDSFLTPLIDDATKGKFDFTAG